MESDEQRLERRPAEVRPWLQAEAKSTGLHPDEIQSAEKWEAMVIAQERRRQDKGKRRPKRPCWRCATLTESRTMLGNKIVTLCEMCRDFVWLADILELFSSINHLSREEVEELGRQMIAAAVAVLTGPAADQVTPVLFRDDDDVVLIRV